MKTQAIQQNNTLVSESLSKKQAPAGQILQAYKQGNSPAMNSSAPVQRKQVDEADNYQNLGIHDTGETFSVVSEAKYSKAGAKWYADSTLHAAATKTEAIGKIAKRAGDIGQATQAVGAEEIGKIDREADNPEQTNGIYAIQANYNKSDKEAIDPFTHGSYCQIGEEDYIVLMYQHTHDLDGYVNGMEEGKIEEDGTFKRTFAENMAYGANKATASAADAADSYGHRHDPTRGTVLNSLANSEDDGKADAITKLAGEGARFEWVRSQIATITDDTLYRAPSRHGKPDLSIRFGDLWCVWKDWFDGAYNIPNSEIDRKLYARADARQISREAKKRIRFNNMKYADYISE